MVDSNTIEVLRWVPGAVAAIDVDTVRAMRARAFCGMFPESDAAEESRLRKQAHACWAEGRDAERGAVMHVAVMDGVCVAAADSFIRTIATEAGDRDVLALGGVATDPDHQGKGFGQAVVRDAFKRVVNGEVAVCLFQTGPARGFYERLGCVKVDNRFVNGLGEPPDQNPWIDQWVMRFPADGHWPEGEMDLRGAGY